MSAKEKMVVAFIYPSFGDCWHIHLSMYQETEPTYANYSDGITFYGLVKESELDA